MWYPAVICITFKELLLSAKVQFLIGYGKYLTIFFTSDFLFRQIRQTYSLGEFCTLYYSCHVGCRLIDKKYHSLICRTIFVCILYSHRMRAQYPFRGNAYDNRVFPKLHGSLEICMQKFWHPLKNIYKDDNYWLSILIIKMFVLFLQHQIMAEHL